MDKPLIRWTIGGNVSLSGLQALAESIRLARKFYDDFDFTVCHNGLSPKGREFISGLGVPLVDQNDFKQALTPQPRGAAWVMYPPRLRLSSHEIILDNDLLLTNRLPQVDDFLKSDKQFMLTQGVRRAFGKCSHLVPDGLKLNSGFMGLPPGYDFTSALERTIKRAKLKRWNNHLDSQGILSVTLLRENPIIIPKTHIALSPVGKLIRGKYGIHFIKINGTEEHKGWKQYRAEILKMI